MKKFITYLLAVLFAGPLLAQGTKYDPTEGAILDGKTLIKGNITSSLLHSYSAAIERALTRNISLQVSATYMPQGKLPYWSKITNSIEEEKSVTLVQDFNVGIKSITPELRLYLSSNGYGRGLYIAPYYRYEEITFGGLKYNIEDKLSNEASTYVKGHALIQGTLKGRSYGVAIGAQWNLGKYLVLDWTIIGGHYGKADLSFKGTVKADPKNQTGFTEEDFENLKNDIDQNIKDSKILNYSKDNITYDLEKRTISSKKDTTPWGFIRGSISLGIRL